jgi:hypothetical protein
MLKLSTYVVGFLISGAAGGTRQRWRAGDRSLVVMSFAVCGTLEIVGISRVFTLSEVLGILRFTNVFTARGTVGIL